MQFYVFYHNLSWGNFDSKNVGITIDKDAQMHPKSPSDLQDMGQHLVEKEDGNINIWTSGWRQSVRNLVIFKIDNLSKKKTNRLVY